MTGQLLKSNKDKYRHLCEQESTIPIFNQTWWLNTVCGDGTWDVCLVEKGDQIVASMPYFVKKEYGFTRLTLPPLTQNLGPWIRPSKAKYGKMLGQQKDLMQSLIEKLPPYQFLEQNWHYEYTNWLPFYWKGFEQTTRYTYVIENLKDLDVVWQNTQANIKTDVRKSESKFHLKVYQEQNIDEFIKLNKLTFSRQSMSIPYSEDLVKNIFTTSVERKQGRLFVARDEQGRNHAGVFIVWDEKSAYYILGGGDPELRNSGATSLCMWEAIKFASTVTEKFDFEGSMLESVERFFRGFGAIQKSYFAISKVPSKLLRSALALKRLIR